MVGPGARGDPASARLGGRAADQLARGLPAEAHAALRGVHRLGDGQPVRPQVAAERERRLPVQPPPGLAQRVGHHVGGRERDARGRRLAGHRERRRLAGRVRLERAAGPRQPQRPAGRRGRHSSGTSTQRRSCHDRIPSSDSCTPRAAGAEVPRERLVERDVAQEPLPLDLERVVGLAGRHRHPRRAVVDRVGEVRVPDRARGGGAGLDPALAQAGHGGAVGAVDLQLEQLAAVDAHAPRRVELRDHAALELEHRVRGVLGVGVVGLAALVVAQREVRRAEREHAAHGAEQLVEHVPPVGEHVGDDPAAVLPPGSSTTAAGAPGRARGTPSSRTRRGPTARARARRCRAARLSVRMPGEEELVLDDAVLDAGLVGQPRELERGLEVLGDRLLAVDVPAGLDRRPHRALAAARDLGVEVHLVVRIRERASRSVVQRSSPCAAASARSLRSSRPTSIGSGHSSCPGPTATPPCSRIARIERMRCWLVPMRPVTPFITIPIVRAPAGASSSDWKTFATQRR